MVVSVRELHQRRQSSIENGRRSETRVFHVVCDDVHDGTTVALTANDGTRRIPYDREQHPTVPACFATSIAADPIANSNNHYEVVVKYEGGTVDEIPVHPLDRPPEFNWGASEFTEPWFTDYSDPPKLFANSAGERFDQLYERENADLHVSMTRNESNWDVLAADAFKNTANADIVFLDGQGYAPGTLRLGPITAQKVTELWMGLPVEFYRVTYVFKAKKDTWVEQVNDVGMYELRNVQVPDDEGGTVTVRRPFPILDGNGFSQIVKPWPLDGAGKPKPSITDEPAKLEFRPYRAVVWAPLNFA